MLKFLLNYVAILLRSVQKVTDCTQYYVHDSARFINFFIILMIILLHVLI